MANQFTNYFTNQDLTEAGLIFADEASKDTFLNRVFFDLLSAGGYKTVNINEIITEKREFSSLFEGVWTDLVTPEPYIFNVASRTLVDYPASLIVNIDGNIFDETNNKNKSRAVYYWSVGNFDIQYKSCYLPSHKSALLSVMSLLYYQYGQLLPIRMVENKELKLFQADGTRKEYFESGTRETNILLKDRAILANLRTVFDISNIIAA